jgi:cell wall-associated NlpC family hydrolase
MGVSKRLAGLVALAFVATAVSAPLAAAEPSSLASKEAQAQRVLGQIRSLDSSLSRAIEAYNLANIQLERIEGDLAENRVRLAIVKRNLRRAQSALAHRLVTIYVSGSTNSTLEVLLGARTLDDVLSGIETQNRVSTQDASVLGEVKVFRAEARARAQRLKRARARQAQLVRQRASQKASIETQIGQRQQLLSSIKDEITRIQAAERARQEELARQARERITRQPAFVASPVVAVLNSAEPSEGLAAPPPARYGGVVGIAMRYLGIPYVYGGASPSGFDCSGFIMYVYAQVGVSLPHNAAMQYGYGTPVDRSQLQPGDLVFFNGLGHNGMYIGGGQFIHSPHTGDVVKISSISGWYSERWVGARRL